MEQALAYLEQDPVLHTDMLEGVRRGSARVLQAEENGVLLYDTGSGAYLLSAKSEEAARRLLSAAERAELVVAHRKYGVEYAEKNSACVPGCRSATRFILEKARCPRTKIRPKSGCWTKPFCRLSKSITKALTTKPICGSGCAPARRSALLCGASPPGSSEGTTTARWGCWRFCPHTAERESQGSWKRSRPTGCCGKAGFRTRRSKPETRCPLRFTAGLGSVFQSIPFAG